jgi:Putative peptidoglycan binding domain
VALVLSALAFPWPGPAGASVAPVDGRSMWIWYLSKSDGGSVPAIIARARAAGVGTLIVKSSDGANYWSQFTPGLVRELREGGLHVCAWQYVYGTEPVAEADLGARAAAAGAQCLIIDAEAEYEGRYASAATYLHELRRQVGGSYPLGLASFPYVDNHPAFPYSVFLGAGGAQFDMPQMYWVEIGLGPGSVFRHTYTDNRIYRRPIFPLGQTYGSPPAEDVQLFRGLAVRYGSPGISWWDYAWTSAEGFWAALSGLYTPAGAPPLGYPGLGPGSSGDEVLWMQEHLAREFPGQRTTGLFGPLTLGILRAFQERHGLPVTGSTDPATWRELLRLEPVGTAWGAAALSAGASGRARRGRAFGPPSASLPARRYEIPEVGSDRAPAGRSHAEA